MKKEDEEFLDALGEVFEENEECLIQAMKTLEMKPNPDGKLFSKEFRDHMSAYGNISPLEALKDKNFWQHLAKYAGMSEEDFEKIGK